MSENIHKKSNRLIEEKSPYLLQHAYNPVDWYPWCEEAFEKAYTEDKPIFLSIGYSTCHWCHVMEKESFEDNEVAKLLNNDFISIKVDREERPDIDSIYMTYCQAITGSGGWPLTIIMTPDKKPFFAGTYFPKASHYGRSGIIDILSSISQHWKNSKQKIIDDSEHLLKDIKNFIITHKEESIDSNVFEKLFSDLKHSFDNKYGGFGNQPKFPTPQKILFLLRYWKINKDKEVLNMVEKTLMNMYAGGIFDHIGFGFSRYSTDNKWLVPHFEKMLYDNALLAIAYIETYQATNNDFYRYVAENIFEYILRDMTDEKGGFYSAEDADSEGVEGKFYVWTKDEIYKILGNEDGKFYCDLYGITEEGNFEGYNILNFINKDIYSIFHNRKQLSKIESIRFKLFNYREKRIHPHKDDKILTSWNGMMIAALAYGGRVFKNKQYVDAAEKAADFVLTNLVNTNGRLLSMYRDDKNDNLGFLDDYVYFVWSLTELYEATFKSNYLEKAIMFNKDMINLFWDDASAGFYLYGKDSEELIFRPKDIYDGAIPSGNSVAVFNMIRLLEITNDPSLESTLNKQINIFGGNINSNPEAYAFFITALMYKLKGMRQIVICQGKDNHIDSSMVDELNKKYIPFTLTIINDNYIKNLVPFLANQNSIDGKTTLYICENFCCKNPITKVEDLIDYIK